MRRRATLSEARISQRAGSIFVKRGNGAPTRDVAAAMGLTRPAFVQRLGAEWPLFRRAIVQPIRTPGKISARLDERNACRAAR